MSLLFCSLLIEATLTQSHDGNTLHLTINMFGISFIWKWTKEHVLNPEIYMGTEEGHIVSDRGVVILSGLKNHNSSIIIMRTLANNYEHPRGQHLLWCVR